MQKSINTNFKKDCKVINLAYEYKGYTGKEKYAIITDLSEEELNLNYKDEIEKEYIFTAKSFIDFLVHKNDFTQYKPIEMRVRLQQLGAYKEGVYWHMPISSIPEQEEKPIEIDFRDKETEQEDF